MTVHSSWSARWTRAAVLAALVVTAEPLSAVAEPPSQSLTAFGTPGQNEPLVTPLGTNASATTYWVDEPEGFHVSRPSTSSAALAQVAPTGTIPSVSR